MEHLLDNLISNNTSEYEKKRKKEKMPRATEWHETMMNVSSQRFSYLSTTTTLTDAFLMACRMCTILKIIKQLDEKVLALHILSNVGLMTVAQ